jgi:hypothetical protein
VILSCLQRQTLQYTLFFIFLAVPSIDWTYRFHEKTEAVNWRLKSIARNLAKYTIVRSIAMFVESVWVADTNTFLQRRTSYNSGQLVASSSDRTCLTLYLRPVAMPAIAKSSARSRLLHTSFLLHFSFFCSLLLEY